MKKTSTAARAIAATPPTEPPTIAPIGVGDNVGIVVDTAVLVAGVVVALVVLALIVVEVFIKVSSVIILSNQAFKPTEVDIVVEEAEAHGAPIEPLISS